MSPAMSVFFKITALTGMLVGLPLLGVYAAGHPVMKYLEFPPETRFVQHEPFAWWAFVAMALAIALVAVPMSVWILKSCPRSDKRSVPPLRFGFPWWGWSGVAAGSVSWVAAWTRLSLLADYQAHSFVPLWLSYIVVINALTYRRTGHCMLIDRPILFLCLFPTSSAFWWYFEYLNRFVQNWDYVGVQYGPWEYFRLATLSFSTVLPAVLGTKEWILSHEWMPRDVVPPGVHSPSQTGRIPSCGRDGSPIRSGDLLLPRRRYLVPRIHKWFPETLKEVGPQTNAPLRIIPWCVLIASGIGLALIGVLPNYLFPLMWVSPLLIIVSLQAMLGERHIVSHIAEGEWAPSVSAALAALLCGWFWEMWNYFSLAKWEYSIPFVDRFHLFEMPILGYAGYLPFGLECLVIGLMVEKLVSGNHREATTS